MRTSSVSRPGTDGSGIQAISPNRRLPNLPCCDPFATVTRPRHRVELAQYQSLTDAGRNTARIALAAELLASMLADLTDISISTTERWPYYAKRD